MVRHFRPELVVDQVEAIMERAAVAEPTTAGPACR